MTHGFLPSFFRLSFKNSMGGAKNSMGGPKSRMAPLRSTDGAGRRRACLCRWLGALLALVPLAAPLAAAGTTLKMAPHADLATLDPIATTAYIARNHGYLVYDTLFAMDENLVPRPQMVQEAQLSDDRLTWEFRLRPGLFWHDGQPVTAQDCIASLKRWGARDGMGQQLFSRIAKLEAVDERRFRLHLRRPYGLVIPSLAKISSNVPFMMPERIAQTDPTQPITDATGSGPFIFVKEEWIPGIQVVYRRNPHYRPRPEPASSAAGGKVARVERIEWKIFADQRATASALLNQEIDIFEQPANDLVQILERDPNITVRLNDPLGYMGVLRFNHQQPPFDDLDLRRIVMMAISQEDFMRGAVGDERFWRTCLSIYPCDSPYASDIGTKVYAAAGLEDAQKALAQSAYDGRPLVLLQPTDIPVLSSFAQIAAARLRQIGFAVELQAMDWATLTARRTEKGAVTQGGWNLFPSAWLGVDLLDPTAIAFSGDPEGGWFGWADNPELEAARTAFAEAQSQAQRLVAAKEVQRIFLDHATTATLGQYFFPLAHSKRVSGLLTAPVPFLWNLELQQP